MNKKLLLTLTLLLALCSGAWADYSSSTVGTTTTLSWDFGEITFANNVDDAPYSSPYNYEGLSCVMTYNKGKDYITSGGFHSNGASSTTNRYISYTPTYSGTLTVTFVSNNSGDAANRTTAIGTKITASATAETDGVLSIADASTGTVSANLTAGVTYYIWLAVGGQTIKTIQYAYIVDAPSITATDASIVATESGVEATQNIAVTGVNLAGSTLTATLSPAVTGLSVTLASNTISTGSISTTATLHYTQTENATGSTTLTLSDGTTSKNVTINYTSKVVPWTLQSISEAKTWDFENDITGEDVNGNNDYQVYANLDLTFESSFDATSISGKCSTSNFLYRKSYKCAQGSGFKLNTTVPGTVQVFFSNTGNNDARYVTVNGIQGSVGPTTATKTSETFYVGSGDVVIGYTGGLRFYKIVFTPVTSTKVAVGEKLYRTFASKWPLDFTTPVEGLTAYRATVAGDAVSFVPVTGKVPAGEGLLLKATTAKEYTLTVPSGDVAAIENALVGVTSSTTVPAGTFVLFDGTSGIGFYKTKAESFTVGANTAYLPAGASARSFVSLDDESTGISTVNSEERIVNSEVYDLQGRRVAAPQKGLYIVNGKKIIIK